MGAGLVGLVVSAGYAAAWFVLVERPTCQGTGVFACTGPAILMYVVGVPVTYVLWSLGLRAVRAPLPWLAPVVVLLALFLVVQLTVSIEPPLWFFPVVAALACAAWARLLGAAAPTGPAEE